MLVNTHDQWFFPFSLYNGFTNMTNAYTGITGVINEPKEYVQF
ncbi:hypothetical protein THF1C08_30174 [Vibrio jasicida]|uniref:Uncharacterized protein n=1 Tax=Vibrio jasicida TaxID=766224 RepID=A0AAU9QV18_9VIBR|nr:hypothetical protein THF1C08_30174 [Vibrio jasicida]CAH1599738.1 hypothetical protein THF1A12_40261 [Vibrio jasicida]